MANEFKIKKGLIVTGASGGTVVDIQGSQGQLFSVTDNLSGSIFAVSDISGVPILDVNSSGVSYFDGSLGIGTDNPARQLEVVSSGGIVTVLTSTTGGSYISMEDSTTTSDSQVRFGAIGNNAVIKSGGATALTLDTSQNAAFEADVSIPVGNKLYFGGGSHTYIGEDINDRLRFFTGGIEFMRFTEDTADTVSIYKDTTFTKQAFATIATSSGDATSTLTTKGYVDSLITGATIYRGAWDPSGGGYGSPDLSGVTQTSGYYYICSADGTAEPNGTGCEPDSWSVGDWVIWNDDIVDCAGTGTGGWQKIDNSSVLSGVGTGQTVALWEGAGSVTDSETLGNAPITISGNNATFAGSIDSGNIVITNSGVPKMTLLDSGNGGGGGASGKIVYSNNDGNAIGLGYTADLTTNSDFIISTDAGSTYGGYLGLNAAAIVDPSSIIIDPKTNVYITKAVGIGVETPNDLLDIHNSATGAVDAQMNFTTAATGTGTSDGFRVGWNGTVAQMYLFEDADMRFATNNSEKMTITSAGGISFGSTGTAYGTSGQVLTSAGNASPTWTTPTTGTVTGSGTANQVAFWDGTSSISGNNNLYWDSTNDHLGIGDATPNSRLKVTSGVNETSIYTVDINHVRNDANVATHAMRLNVDLSGADTTTADRTNSALNIDIDSAANGDASNEHRIYGVNTVVNFTGFSDLVRGGYFLAESNYTGAKTAQLVGVYGYAIHDASDTAGGVSNMVGTYGISSIQDKGDVDNALGAYGLVSIGDNRTEDVGVTKGVEGEILIDKSTALNYGTMIGISSIIDNNEGSVPNFGTQYLFKGDYQGDKGPTAYGIWCEGDKHYFSGNVGIGATNPDEKLDILGKQIFSGTGSSYYGNPAAFNTASNGDKIIFYNDGTSYDGRIGVGSTSNLWLKSYGETANEGDIEFYAGGSQRVIVKGSGDVGIGTTTPGQKLDVRDGTITSRDSGNVNYAELDRFSGLTLKGNGAGAKYISTPNTDDLAFSTNSSEKMRITSGGNVGIGTSTPGAKLDIQGTQGQLFSVTDDLSGEIFAVADISGVPIMTVDSSGVSYFDGNVGIGTTSPSEKLHVFNAGTAMIRVDSGSTSPYKAGIEFIRNSVNGGRIYNDGGAVQVKIESDYGYEAANPSRGGFQFKTAPVTSGTLVDAVRIDALGNVGIGITNPAVPLDVEGKIRSNDSNSGDYLEIFCDGSVSGYNYITTSANDLLVAPQSGGLLVQGENSGSGFDGRIQVYNALNAAVKVKLHSNGDSYLNGGNVGIGTTLPATDLHVNSENAEGSLTISRSGNNMISGQGVGSIVFPADYNGTPTNYGKIVTYANTLSALRGSIDFKVKSTSGSLLTGLTVYGTSSGANVGIGTTDPLGKLMVREDLAGSPARLIISNAGTVQSGTSARLSFYEGTSEKSYIERRRDGSGKTAFVTPADDNPFVWENTSGEIMRINNSNVGIGATNPASKLTVGGNATGFTTAMQVWQDGETALSGDVGGKAATFFGTSGLSNSSIVNIYATGAYTGQTGGEIGFGGKYASGGNVAQFAKIRSFKTNASNGGTNYGGGMEFWTRPNGSAAVPRMTILGDGSVGVGTTSPAGLFHLYDGSPVLQIMTNSGADGQANTTMSRIIGQARGYGMVGDEMCSIDFVTNATTWYKGDIVFKTNDVDGTDPSKDATERMRIASNGNVGVGFTSPDLSPLSTMKLSVNGNAYVAGYLGIGETSPSVPLHISRNSASGENIALLLDNNNTATQGSQIGILFRCMADGANTDFEIFGEAKAANTMDLVFQSDGSVERMRLKSDGDLQIARYLEHLGDTNSYLGWSAADDFRIYTGGRELLRLDEGTDPDVLNFMSTNFSMSTGGELKLLNNGGAKLTFGGNGANPTTTAATIYDQSTVGLTLSSHNVELRNYNGSSMVRSVFFTHNSATFTGTCTATNFILSSDKTLKENIKDIDNNHIDVSWKNFELKSEPGVKRSGVIAQELETKHPEFVRTDKEGLKSVAYVDLLIAKIAELEARLEKAGI